MLLLLPSQNYTVPFAVSKLIFNITPYIIRSSCSSLFLYNSTSEEANKKGEIDATIDPCYPTTLACKKQSECSHKGVWESHWIYSSRSQKFTFRKNVNMTCLCTGKFQIQKGNNGEFVRHSNFEVLYYVL